MEIVNNDRLNQLLKLDPKKMNLDEYIEFLDELQNSKLLMPLECEGDLFEMGINFPLILFSSSDELITPLFTDEEQLNFPDMDILCLDMEDILEVLDDIGVDFIVINPFSENKIKFRVKSLINKDLAKKLKLMHKFRILLYNNSITLSEDLELYYRTDNVVDTLNTKMPFNVTLDKDYENDIPYLHVLKLSSGDKIMPADVVFEFGHKDHIILAPDTEFELIDKKDDNTFIWKCVNQPFYK